MKLNKYVCLFVCVLCATSTSFAKKKKTSEIAEKPAAEEVAKNNSAEDDADFVDAEEAPAVETADKSAPVAEEAAAEPAPAEETVADATATEEVAEASEEAVEESEDVSDDEEDAVEKKSKKKKKKSKKKKSKKKKKKKHSDDDEDSDEGATGVKLGFHAGLGSNVLEIEHGANGSLNLGLGFAYFFTKNMAVVSGADLNIAATQSKVLGYTYSYYGYTSYEYTMNNGVASIVVPVKFRFAFNDMFWAEAGSGIILSLYSYNMYSGDNKPADGGATTFIGDITNFTLGAGVKVGGGSLGLEIGYRSVLSVGVNYNSGF